MSDETKKEETVEVNHPYWADCTQCGRHFYLKQNEYDFYVSQSYQMPKRCKTCRTRRKAKEQQSFTPPVKTNKDTN